MEVSPQCWNTDDFQNGYSWYIQKTFFLKTLWIPMSSLEHPWMLAQRLFQHADTDPKKSQFLINFYGTHSRKQWPMKYSPCFVEKYREVISRESVTGIVCTQRASNWAENTDFGRRIITTGRKFAPLFSPSILPCSIISDCLCLFSAPLPMIASHLERIHS